MASSHNSSKSRDELSVLTKTRISNEINALKKDVLHGIHVFPNDKDITRLDAIIEGPEDTPYAGGFFYFRIHFPHTYPNLPPSVKLMTTGYGTVRFNPNFLECGAVCLSILGTWSGPQWSSTCHDISAVLISLQALMDSEPFFNDTGYNKSEEYDMKLSKAYNEKIEYETLRVAVAGSLTNIYGDITNAPKELEQKISSLFVENYDKYITKANSKIGGNPRNHLLYSDLKCRFEQLKSEIDARMETE